MVKIMEKENKITKEDKLISKLNKLRTTKEILQDQFDSDSEPEDD